MVALGGGLERKDDDDKDDITECPSIFKCLLSYSKVLAGKIGVCLLLNHLSADKIL